MSYLLILLLTIYVSSRADLMYENITGVASLPQYHGIVIIYTISLSLFFAYKMLGLFKKMNMKYQKKYQCLIIFTAMTMSSGAFFPYQINGKDFFSSLHVYCSMGSCISFLILLLIYTYLLSIYKPTIYLKTHLFFYIPLQFLCILFVVLTRVNGYLEILFTCIVCGYLYILESTFKKEF